MSKFVSYLALAMVAIQCNLSAAPASAQTPQIIEPGQTVVGSANKSDQPNLYYFAGGAGSTITAKLEAEGKSSLMLFTPQGEEMLSSEGDGDISLEAILPLNEAYILAIARTDPARPYRLSLSATKPDMMTALFSRRAGYEEYRRGEWHWKCWTIPGSQLRSVSSKNVTEETLSPNGNIQVRTFDPNTGSETSSFWEAHKIDGRTRQVEYLGPDGYKDPPHEIPPSYFDYSGERSDGSPFFTHGENYRYKGYLC